MADILAEQPVRTLAAGDVLVGVLDDTVNQIDPRDVRALTVVKDTVKVANPVGTVGDLNATVAGTLTVANPIGTVGDLNATVTGTVNAVQDTPGNLLVEVSGDALDDILEALGGAGTNSASYGYADLSKSGQAGDDDSASPQTLTVTSGKILVMDSIVCASTAAARYEVKIGVSASEATKYVAFTSESSPLFVIQCGGYNVPDTEQVIIIKKNLDNQALTVYNTINYYEKPAT